MSVHPSARIAASAKIADGAEIGPGVEIGEFSIVEDDVVIGEGCRLESHVVVKRWTTLGKGNKISVGTVLGTDPLDKNFSGERSYLRDRRRQHHSRALHDQPRHRAGIRRP